MAGKHRDNSTRMNEGSDTRPIVDRSLERDADRASMTYLRHGIHPTRYLEGYGHRGKGPKGYRRSDESIREDVCEALYRSHEVDASGIDVDVKDSCVYLRGEVEDRQMKREAETAVEHVSGVEDVQNLLSLKKRVIPERNTKLS